MNYERTDRLDATEIHRRFYNDDEYNNHYHDDGSKNKKSGPKQKKDSKTIEKSKSKINFTSVIVFLSTLLFLATIVLVITTISNNKALNDKINNLSNQTEVTDTEEPTDAEESETTEPTKKEEEFEGSGETKSGKLIQALNLRSGPGYDYSVVAVIPEGTEVSGEIVNGWLKIEYNGQVGYIGPKFVE